jgi:hypothetical protein
LQLIASYAIFSFNMQAGKRTDGRRERKPDQTEFAAGFMPSFDFRIPMKRAGSRPAGKPKYTALGHKLRFFRRWKAQFVTVGIIAV